MSPSAIVHETAPTLNLATDLARCLATCQWPRL